MNTNTKPDSKNNAPQVLLTPLKAALIAGHAQKLHVLVRVQAPDADPAAVKPRPPYSLALVIDRSGSMAGEPLQEAVRCARHIVDNLQPADRAAIVQFDSHVLVLAPAVPVADRRHLHQALDAIHEGGTTNLHGGWAAGAKSLRDFAREVGLARVILLSDGNANVGEVDPLVISGQCAAMAAEGVTTSTYGLGHSFNEDLMVSMAQAGQGSHYYGETAKDLFEPFAEEFDLIASLHARRVRLTLGVPDGVSVRVLNDYPLEDQRGFHAVRLLDIAWGSEAWAVVELEVPAHLATEAPAKVLQAEVSGVDLDGNPVAFPEAVLSLPAVPPMAWEALLTDALVRQRLDELLAGRMLVEARRLAARGDWEAIDALLEQARQQFAGYPWVSEVLANLERIARSRDLQRFSKESLYSTRRMNTRLSAKDEALDTLNEVAVPSFLRRKQAQGKAQYRKGDDKKSDY
jgi:Ca-activated chloride channel family protein